MFDWMSDPRRLLQFLVNVMYGRTALQPSEDGGNVGPIGVSPVPKAVR